VVWYRDKARNTGIRGLLQWLKSKKSSRREKKAFQGLQKAGIRLFHPAKSRFSGLKKPVIRLRGLRTMRKPRFIAENRVFWNFI